MQQPQEQEMVGGNYNVLVHYVDASVPNPGGVVLCNPFQIRYCVVHVD
jgi:hypothetical protein